MTHADFVADSGIARQRHTLADGRDLIYFDDPDTKLLEHRAPTCGSSIRAPPPPVCGRIH